MKLHAYFTYRSHPVLTFCMQGNKYRQQIGIDGNMYGMNRHDDINVDFF